MQKPLLERRSLLQDSNTLVYGSTCHTEAAGPVNSTMSAPDPPQTMKGLLESHTENDIKAHKEDGKTEGAVCKVCYCKKPAEAFTSFLNCGHRFCTECVTHVFEKCVTESRVGLQCLQCTGEITVEEIKSILSPQLYEKYLNFTLKRYLATVPNVRHCPSPDCPYACIDSTENGMPPTNHFVCEREECHKEYCYHCKCPWHPDKSCQQARDEISITMPEAAGAIPEETLKNLKAKECPFCHATVEKLEDGSCNQVSCINCGESFCWLCGRHVTEMHYLSPTGCPMYGQQRWTTRKKYCCRFWLWVTAPWCILLAAFLAFPIILIAFPILIGYLIYRCTKDREWYKVCVALMVILAIVICILVDPLVTLIAVLILIPLALFYIYCFIPIHVCMQSSE